MQNLFAKSFLVSLLLTPAFLNAQTDESESIFTKKNRWSGALAIKTNPIRLFNGDFPLLFEVPLAEKWHIEAGPSLLYYDLMSDLIFRFYYPYNPLGEFDKTIFSLDNARLSVGLNAQIKYFIDKDPPVDGPTCGFRYTLRTHHYDFELGNIRLNPGKVRVQEFCFTFTYQQTRRRITEYGCSLGAIHYRMDYADAGNATPAKINYTAAIHQTLRPKVGLYVKKGILVSGRKK